MDKEKIMYDTPMYTFEGITKAARDFAIALDDHYKIMLSDFRYTSAFSYDFSGMYNAIDLNPISGDHHIYLRNTRPEYLKIHMSENLFLYHVYEGDKLISKHVEAINTSPNLKCVLFPSSHNAKTAEMSGVNKPVEVVPHILGNIYVPDRRTDSTMTRFFYSGAIYGLTSADRKGVDLVLKAWKKYKDDTDKELILKINTFYADNTYAMEGKKFNLKYYLNQVYGEPLPPNIKVMVANISEEDLVRLYNVMDVVLYPSRGEGFGLVPFEALGCGTPIIVTEGLGPDEYLQHLGDKGNLKIPVKQLISPDKRFPYYDKETGEESKWSEPDFEVFEKQITYFIEHKEELQKGAEEASKILHEVFSHENIGKRFKEVFDKYKVNEE